MKIVRMKNTVFHLIPYCCAETAGTVGKVSGKNYLWLWWMFCFEPHYNCPVCDGSGFNYEWDRACGKCNGDGYLRKTQGQLNAEALVKAYPLKVKLWTPVDNSNPTCEPRAAE